MDVSCVLSAHGCIWDYPSRIQDQPFGRREQPQFPPGKTCGNNNKPCHTCGKGPAGLCWGSGCGGAAPAVQFPIDPSIEDAVPSQWGCQGEAHKYLLSREAPGSLQVNIVGAVTLFVHSQGCGHICHWHEGVLGWESSLCPTSSGLGSQFYPEPHAVPQCVLCVLGDQGKYSLLLLQPLRNNLEITPGMVCREENPRIANYFTWLSLGVQSHSPVPVPGAHPRTSLSAGGAVSQGC